MHNRNNVKETLGHQIQFSEVATVDNANILAPTYSTFKILASSSSFFFFLNNHFCYLFIYLWLCWVFVSVRGLSPVAASGGHPSSRCAGLSLSRPLLLRSTGSRRAGSAIVAHRPSCSGHVGSSQTRARTRVPCISRQTLNHCATREASWLLLCVDLPPV